MKYRIANPPQLPLFLLLGPDITPAAIVEYDYDSPGNLMSLQLEVPSDYSTCRDDSGRIDLIDSIPALHIASGKRPDRMVHSGCDITSDKKIRQSEAVFDIKSVSEQ